MTGAGRLSMRLMAGALIVGAMQAGAAIGAVGTLQVRPGHTSARGRTLRRTRPDAHDQTVRLQAAEAKRVRRQERNLRWRARGAFGRR